MPESHARDEDAGCSKWPSSKAAARAATEAYLYGTSQGGVRRENAAGGLFQRPANLRPWLPR